MQRQPWPYFSSAPGLFFREGFCRELREQDERCTKKRAEQSQTIGSVSAGFVSLGSPPDAVAGLHWLASTRAGGQIETPAQAGGTICTRWRQA